MAKDFLGLFRARALLHLAQQHALSPMAHGFIQTHTIDCYFHDKKT
jgi:hypothetical protein